MSVGTAESRAESERLALRRGYPRRLMTAAALVAILALFLSSCEAGGNGTLILSGSPVPPGSGASVPPASEYRRVLHPYWLFLGFDRGIAAENRLISLCMRARGWDRFPLLTGDSRGESRLNLIQTVRERRHVVMTYGARMLSQSTRSTGSDDLEALQKFSDWLVEQPDAVRAKYDKDFSGGRAEIDAPAKGSCKAQALERVRPTIPSSDPAVAARAGVLYGRYVTGTRVYRRAEQAWRTCMIERGFPHVGEPLTVWHPGLDEQLDRAPALSETGKARLARALTRQAVAEHECAVESLDDVVRTGELRVLHALVEEFPQYAKLVTG